MISNRRSKNPTRIVKLKHNEKVIGKVGLQFGKSFRTGAETFAIKPNQLIFQRCNFPLYSTLL